MDNLDLHLENHKLTKTLPKQWVTFDKDKPDKEMFVMEDFACYLKKLYQSLMGIKKFYENDFNKDNNCTIDEYIALFNSAFNKIIKLLIPSDLVRKEILKSLKGEKREYDTLRFELLEKTPKYESCFKHDKDNNVVGFSDETFDKISKYAKQLFMIEKFCSFTTRKFWQQEITKVNQLDFNKPYKILVKCVFPDGWRKENKSKKLDKFMKSKKFHSTSLIDDRHFYNTFFAFSNQYALLIMDYEDNDFVCASATDSYSEEVIDRENLLKDKKIFSDILLQKDESIDDKVHKFYAEAVECETPKNILENVNLYTEVNVKDIKPKAVIAPNVASLRFAKEVAKEYGDLPVIIK